MNPPTETGGFFFCSVAWMTEPECGTAGPFFRDRNSETIRENVMKRKPLAELISVLVKGIAPTTAVATSLISPLAQAASGDLDPTFAGQGRLGPIPGLEGAAWSVEALDDGGALVGGGDLDFDFGWYCYYYAYDCQIEASNFTSRLNQDGSIDAAFQAAGVADVEVFGIARQADGKIVAAGRKVTGDFRHRSNRLLVFRLATDGSLDTAFANDGLFELSSSDFGPDSQAHALELEPNGRIVVAGVREIVVDDVLVSELIALRLRADGRLDQSFGAAGVFVGPAVPFDNNIRLARTAAGAYRVANTMDAGCAVVGVTAGGALDAAFGDSGIAQVESAPGEGVFCQSLAVQDDGRLLLAGNAAGHGFAARLLSNGTSDPSFAPDAAVAESMDDATSVATTADGRILIAGLGLRGASVMRLQATGQLDSLFGNGGRTWIDLLSENGSAPIVRDMAVREDGSVIAAGGDLNNDSPFVVRLLGDGGGDSAGVLSITDYYVEAAESDGQSVVRVRRSGGSAGDVNVEYRTVAGEASPDADYTAASGTLHWADGDTSEREIVVEIADDDGPPEAYESLRIALGDAEGGAGIGTQNATIYIQADGAPAGQIMLDYVEPVVLEAGVAPICVGRYFYSEGEVSVTITPTGITAEAGADFNANPVTVTWAAGEAGGQCVEIALPDDNAREDSETLRIELSDPTGGAILGTNTSHAIAIAASDQPVPPPSGGGGGGGGGGAAGFLSLLLLGLAELFRSARRCIHRDS